MAASRRYAPWVWPGAQRSQARTVAPNQINAVAVTAPEGLQDQLKGAHNP